MGKPEDEVTKAQPTDLEHHKTEETDNLQKSATPDKSYMDAKELDVDTHGKKSE